MSNFKRIREKLNLRQAALALELGMSQANVSKYDNGQEIPPAVAKRVIELAASRGVQLSYDDVYGELTNA